MADEAPVEDNSWMETYADAITLLMAFFVMMLTFAKYDMPAYEAAVNAIKSNISKEEQGPTTTEQMQTDLMDVVYNVEGGQEAMNVKTDDKGIVIELASKAFYKPGSATIKEDSRALLKDMGEMLMAPKYGFFRIDVEGHTDDDPISTRQFPSNWELSGGRATGVVRFLVEMGIDSRRLQATAFAETQPKVPNRDENKNPIRANQEVNRRVVVRVYPMDFADRKKFEGTVKIEVESESEKDQGGQGNAVTAPSNSQQQAAPAPQESPAPQEAPAQPQ